MLGTIGLIAATGKNGDCMSDQAAHAKLSPSSSSGWMNCPDYANVQQGYPDTTSQAAAEGTFAHAISDNCFEMGLDAYDFIGVRGRFDGYEFEWTEDDADLLQPGIDRIRELPGKFYGETRVDLSRWMGQGQFGTMDRFIIGEDFAEGDDLKWGRGVPVQAVGNKQVRIYLLGAMARYAPHVTDPEFPVHLNIDQPRCAAGGGRWKITLGELLEFGEEVRVAAALANSANPPRKASKDACLWCKGKHECATYDAFNLEMLSLEFEDLDAGEIELPHLDSLTPARKRVLLDHRQMVSKWLDGVHASVYQAAMRGEDTGGLKLVEGRKGIDAWTDPKIAARRLVQLLGDKAHTKRLIGPAKAGKSISKEDWQPIFNELVKVGERKPTLVDEADDRPAIRSLADWIDDFDDL